MRPSVPHRDRTLIASLVVVTILPSGATAQDTDPCDPTIRVDQQREETYQPRGESDGDVYCEGSYPEDVNEAVEFDLLSAFIVKGYPAREEGSTWSVVWEHRDDIAAYAVRGAQGDPDILYRLDAREGKPEQADFTCKQTSVNCERFTWTDDIIKRVHKGEAPQRLNSIYVRVQEQPPFYRARAGIPKSTQPAFVPVLINADREKRPDGLDDDWWMKQPLQLAVSATNNCTVISMEGEPLNSDAAPFLKRYTDRTTSRYPEIFVIYQRSEEAEKQSANPDGESPKSRSLADIPFDGGIWRITIKFSQGGIELPPFSFELRAPTKDFLNWEALVKAMKAQ